METLTLHFYVDVPPAQQHALLADISRWPAVRQVTRLDPHTADPALRRICFIILKPGHDRDELVRQLLALQEVESAAPPAPRYLLP